MFISNTLLLMTPQLLHLLHVPNLVPKLLRVTNFTSQCTGRMLLTPDRMPKAESKGYRMRSKALNLHRFFGEWLRMPRRTVVRLFRLSQWYVAFEHLQR